MAKQRHIDMILCTDRNMPFPAGDTRRFAAAARLCPDACLIKPYKTAFEEADASISG